MAIGLLFRTLTKTHITQQTVSTRVRGNMQLVNFTHELFDNSPGAANTLKEKVSGSWKRPGLLPGGLLAAAILASILLGSHVQPRDELDWLTRLANQNDAGAQLQLGLAYRDGLYGPSDAKTGLYWLKRSAALGNAFAEDAVGQAYASGQGTPKNQAMAAQWWRKAIEQGDHAARIHLADSLIQAGQVDEANALLN